MSVVFVAGAMRSGTTVTGQMLAESDSTVLVGELRPVLMEPERHEHCDCGHTRAECPFWSRVDAALPAGFDAHAASDALSMSALPRLLAHLVARAPLPAGIRDAVTFFRAVATTAGDRIVIDTSKSPTGILLWRLAGQQTDVVQSWRSVRHVAAAQARPTAETGLVQEPKLRSYAVWSAYNFGAVILAVSTRHYVPLRYDRLLRTPRETANRIWRRIGAKVPDGAGGPRFVWAESHVLAGNPRRTQDGSVTIRTRT